MFKYIKVLFLVLFATSVVSASSLREDIMKIGVSNDQYNKSYLIHQIKRGMLDNQYVDKYTTLFSDNGSIRTIVLIYSFDVAQSKVMTLVYDRENKRLSLTKVIAFSIPVKKSLEIFKKLMKNGFEKVSETDFTGSLRKDNVVYNLSITEDYRRAAFTKIIIFKEKL